MKCSRGNCNEYISRDDLILSAIVMVHWTSSININNHNKIVSVHNYHLGRETWIFQVTKISISQNPRIYYEDKNTRIQRLVVEFIFVTDINFVKWMELVIYKIHTQFNITKTRIYHNNILKIGIKNTTFIWWIWYTKIVELTT